MKQLYADHLFIADHSLLSDVATLGAFKQLKECIQAPLGVYWFEHWTTQKKADLNFNRLHINHVHGFRNITLDTK